MATLEDLRFGMKNLPPKCFKNKDVLEIGALYHNGSLRPFIELFSKTYTGIDIEKGPGVDFVINVYDLKKEFIKKFDLIICLNVLEHVENWRLAVENIKSVCKNGGSVFVSVPKNNFAYHGYPFDYWRFRKQDLETIFSDFEIIKSDEVKSFCYIFAKKPRNFIKTSLKEHSLFCVINNKFLKNIKVNDFLCMNYFKIFLRNLFTLAGRKIRGLLE